MLDLTIIHIIIEGNARSKARAARRAHGHAFSREQQWCPESPSLIHKLASLHAMRDFLSTPTLIYFDHRCRRRPSKPPTGHQIIISSHAGRFSRHYFLAAAAGRDFKLCYHAYRRASMRLSRKQILSVDEESHADRSLLDSHEFLDALSRSPVTAASFCRCRAHFRALTSLRRHGRRDEHSASHFAPLSYQSFMAQNIAFVDTYRYSLQLYFRYMDGLSYDDDSKSQAL